jgi:hypothetical protein
MDRPLSSISEISIASTEITRPVAKIIHMSLERHIPHEAHPSPYLITQIYLIPRPHHPIVPYHRSHRRTYYHLNLGFCITVAYGYQKPFPIHGWLFCSNILVIILALKLELSREGVVLLFTIPHCWSFLVVFSLLVLERCMLDYHYDI